MNMPFKLAIALTFLCICSVVTLTLAFTANWDSPNPPGWFVPLLIIDFLATMFALYTFYSNGKKGNNR